MSEKANSAVPEADKTQKAIQGLALLFGDTVKQLVTNAENQEVAVLGLTAMVAMLSSTAPLDPAKLGLVVQVLTAGRKDAEQIRERIAAYVTAAVGIATNLPDVLAKAEAALKNGKTSPPAGKRN